MTSQSISNKKQQQINGMDELFDILCTEKVQRRKLEIKMDSWWKSKNKDHLKTKTVLEEEIRSKEQECWKFVDGIYIDSRKDATLTLLQGENGSNIKVQWSITFLLGSHVASIYVICNQKIGR